MTCCTFLLLILIFAGIPALLILLACCVGKHQADSIRFSDSWEPTDGRVGREIGNKLKERLKRQ